jgi:hypothetical protein
MDGYIHPKLIFIVLEQKFRLSNSTSQHTRRLKNLARNLEATFLPLPKLAIMSSKLTSHGQKGYNDSFNVELDSIANSENPSEDSPVCTIVDIQHLLSKYARYHYGD